MISSLRAMLELARLPDTPIVARIPASRMVVGNVPREFAAKSSALTINRALGSRIKQVRIGEERYNVRLWAATADEAESHYQALAATWRELFNVHLASGALLYAVDVSSAGSHLADPDTGWPFVLVGVEATFAEETVSS